MGGAWPGGPVRGSLRGSDSPDQEDGPDEDAGRADQQRDRSLCKNGAIPIPAPRRDSICRATWVRIATCVPGARIKRMDADSGGDNGSVAVGRHGTVARTVAASLLGPLPSLDLEGSTG